ncbi:MAG TPA: PAS domain S-box protein, partial [Steroidobacteraceae bacterium]|nr:PAS domain S-box protein [Steroidobacteraceae bacterium]
MATPPPDKPAEFTASDILSADAWTGRAPKPVFGLDVACTKIAVDFQSMAREGVEECVRRNLELLRGATGSDCAFLAALHPDEFVVQDVQLARSAFAQCRPEGLVGTGLESFPWLKGRLEHLRLSELRDTSTPRKEQAAEARKLADLQIGSALLVTLRVQGKPAGFLGLAHTLPRGAWDVNVQLMMKLVGTSLASGLERIRTEARLAKLEERTNLFQAAANDGMWDFDVESNEVFFSPRWKAMLGYADEDMRGSPDWRSLVHPDDLARVQAAIRDHVAGKTPIFESTHRMRHRNGEWRWVISRATARVDKHGRLLRLVGVELDITERKLYEEALFREKESAQITLQSIGDGVITTDASSTIDYINPVAEELTGWRLEDAMGRPVEEIFRAFHEETCEPLENPLTVSIRRIRPIKSVRPMLLIRRDGNELYVESTAAPIRDGSGHVAGGVLVFHDVSESRELNRRLSYHASHDLLTGLVNRREFESRLERALKSAKAREAS